MDGDGDGVDGCVWGCDIVGDGMRVAVATLGPQTGLRIASS